MWKTVWGIGVYSEKDLWKKTCLEWKKKWSKDGAHTPKSEELGELIWLEPVSLMIKKSRLRWFGYVERKDDNDWVKRCITWEVEGIRQRGCLKKTWWDCVKNDMESLGLSQKDAQFRNKWRRRIKGQPANPGSPGKMAVKTECVCDASSDDN